MAQREKTGGFAINCDPNMELNDPRSRDFCLDTDDSAPDQTPIAQPGQENQTVAKTIITTTAVPNKGNPEMVSSKVGTNNPAFSRLPIEQRHLIIAQQMNEQFADQIAAAEVNHSAVQKPFRGALFGSSAPARYDLAGVKAHKYFNQIDTSYLM